MHTALIQERLYEAVSEASVSSDDALLLPSFIVTESDDATDVPKYVSRIDCVAVETYLRLEREKTVKALEDAWRYRNLAEHLKTEKRELASKMNEKSNWSGIFGETIFVKGQLEEEKWFKKHLQ